MKMADIADKLNMYYEKLKNLYEVLEDGDEFESSSSLHFSPMSSTKILGWKKGSRSENEEADKESHFESGSTGRDNSIEHALDRMKKEKKRRGKKREKAAAYSDIELSPYVGHGSAEKTKNEKWTEETDSDKESKSESESESDSANDAIENPSDDLPPNQFYTEVN